MMIAPVPNGLFDFFNSYRPEASIPPHVDPSGREYAIKIAAEIHKKSFDSIVSKLIELAKTSPSIVTHILQPSLNSSTYQMEGLTLKDLTGGKWNFSKLLETIYRNHTQNHTQSFSDITNYLSDETRTLDSKLLASLLINFCSENSIKTSTSLLQTLFRSISRGKRGRAFLANLEKNIKVAENIIRDHSTKISKSITLRNLIRTSMVNDPPELSSAINSRAKFNQRTWQEFTKELRTAVNNSFDALATAIDPQDSNRNLRTIFQYCTDNPLQRKGLLNTLVTSMEKTDKYLLYQVRIAIAEKLPLGKS